MATLFPAENIDFMVHWCWLLVSLSFSRAFRTIQGFRCGTLSRTANRAESEAMTLSLL